MKSNLLYIAIFAVGAAVGSAATWQYAKTKYRKIADEEIESVKYTFSRLSENAKKEKNEDDYEVLQCSDLNEKAKESQAAMANYKRVLNEVNYKNYAEEVKPVDGPYVITPMEFGENEDYETESLRYYADGYLTDDEDYIVDDIESMVGCDSLNHFGEFEEDSVFVRNDDMRTDFEILKDERNYKDILIKKQHRQEQ